MPRGREDEIAFAKNRGLTLLLLLPVTIALTIGYAIDYWTLRSRGHEIVEGRVIAREKRRMFGIIKRSVLTIEFGDRAQRVQAILWMDSSDSIGDIVHFEFTGDVDREVQLEEETSSLIGASLFGLLPCFGLLICWLVIRRSSHDSGRTRPQPRGGQASRHGN